MPNANTLGRRLIDEINNGGDTARVRLLLEQEAPVNYRDERFISAIPLSLAVVHSNLAVVRILMAHGADKMIDTFWGEDYGMMNAVQAAVIIAILNPENDDARKIAMELGGYLGPPGGDPNSANHGAHRNLRKKRKSRRYRRN